MPAAYLILVDLTALEIYKYDDSRYCESPHYAIFFNLLLVILSGPNALFSTLFSKTFNLSSSLIMNGHVSHPYKAAVDYVRSI
jgi:hypothetical protein